MNLVKSMCQLIYPNKGRYTLETAKKEIPEIEEDLILLYEQEIEKKLNIS